MRQLLLLIVSALCFATLQAQTTSPASFSKLPDGNYRLDDITIRTAAAELAFPATFVLTDGALEVIIAKPDGRLHETLLVTPVPAVKIQAALYLLKARNGLRLPGKTLAERQGTLVDIDIEWTDDKDIKHRDPIENWIEDRRSHAPMKRLGWVFTGSTVHQGKFMADSEGNVVINCSQGATILDSPDPASEDDTLHAVNTAQPQPVAHPGVTVVFKPRLRP